MTSPATTTDDRREPARLSPEEGRYPTAEEFVGRWHLLSREQRLGVAGRVLVDAEAASACFMGNHEAELAELRAALRASIERENVAAAELVSLRGQLEAATELAEHLTVTCRYHDHKIERVVFGRPEPCCDTGREAWQNVRLLAALGGAR